MNINLVCVARNTKAKEQLPLLFDAAVADANEIFSSPRHRKWVKENMGIYNADRVGGTWKPQTWYEDHSQIISVSQPPIPLDYSCDENTYWEVVRGLVASQKYESFLPNHFGVHRRNDGNVRIWSDYLGIGRCYYVINEYFIAASNHIGILAYFLNSEVELNDEGLARYAHTEWFTLDDSPIAGIRRLREGCVLEIDRSGAVRENRYHDLALLVGEREQGPDYDRVISQSRTIASNLDCLSVKTPTVFLSGGRDSRMTASMWLSAGNDARVVTMGTLKQEAVVAQKLMAEYFSDTSFDASVAHDITERSSSTITMGLQERLKNAFSMWDGDAAPINLRTNVRTPGGSAALTIGGAGGEISHGYYYGRLPDPDNYRFEVSPMHLASTMFRRDSVSEFSASHMKDYFDVIYQRSVDDGRPGLLALDYLYLTEKFRRWGNQALGSTSAILLSGAEFVRASFGLTPQGHVNKSLPSGIVERAMPAWSKVPYYKANSSDLSATMSKKLSTFDTDPEYFKSVFESPKLWPKYLSSDRIGVLLEKVENGEAAPAHENTLNRAIWLDYFADHLVSLRARVKSVRSAVSSQVVIAGVSPSESYLSPLRAGFFAARRTDLEASSGLVSGVVEFGNRRVQVFDSNSYEESAGMSRHEMLQLHSLRWIDVLRRSAIDEEQALNARARCLKAWAASEVAQDPDSLAWSDSITIRRSVALVLGGIPDCMKPSLGQLHLDRMREIGAKTLDGSLRLYILRAELGLMDQLNWGRNAALDYLNEVVFQLFDESGYVSAIDLSATLAAKNEWKEQLLALGLDESSNAVLRVSNSEFWTHCLSASGDLLPIGERVPALKSVSDDSTFRYVLSRGESGVPPEAVRCVVPGGPVLLHSGWGETERNVDEETTVSLLLGRVRGRGAHEDLSRVTFSSQGRDWLIDPPESLLRDSSTHSTIYVESQRYRAGGEAQLIREYSDSEVDGFVVNNTCYLPVQWRRHMVFVRSDNYMIVSDNVRSSEELNAFQQWIVAPDVEVVSARGGFLLRADHVAVRLTLVSRAARDAVVEPICDDSGTRLAWRIRVPLSGKGARSTAIISDVEVGNEGGAPQVKYFGAEFSVRYQSGRLSELAVVTPDRTVLFPGDLEPEECISVAIERAASGELDPVQALDQRLAVRSAISGVKDRIRASGSSVAARQAAIEELVEFSKDHKVEGLRDHGLGAALIDIAGTDLTGALGDRATSSGRRRSALVSWSNEDLIQPAYGVPVRTTRSSSSLPSDLGYPFIWSVDHGQLVNSTYVTGVQGQTLTVYFHGATDRSRFTLPRYERLNSMGKLGSGPLMFFSDPTLDLDSRMILSWFVGTEEVNLHSEIARMINEFAVKSKVKDVLLVGNSGGAFTSLQVASYLVGSFVVAFNPQIQIDKYVPRIAKNAHWSSFGRETVKDDPDNASRMDVIRRYREIRFDQDVVLVQNPGDDQHFQDHFKPFAAEFDTSANRKRLKTFTPDLGPGHRVPPVPEYMQYVQDELGLIEGCAQFGGLRAAE